MVKVSCYSGNSQHQALHRTRTTKFEQDQNPRLRRCIQIRVWCYHLYQSGVRRRSNHIVLDRQVPFRSTETQYYPVSGAHGSPNSRPVVHYRPQRAGYPHRQCTRDSKKILNLKGSQHRTPYYQQLSDMQAFLRTECHTHHGSST